MSNPSGTTIVVTGRPAEYEGAADEAVKTLAKREAMSSGSFMFLSSGDTIPSITTSAEDSLERRETNAGSAAIASSEPLIAGILVTLRDRPFRSRPSSSSDRSRNTVSGSRPQTPALEMLISPARCMSAMSFGSVLNTRYSENTELAVLAMTLSTVAPSPDSISTMSEDARPSLASLFLYSS